MEHLNAKPPGLCEYSSEIVMKSVLLFARYRLNDTLNENTMYRACITLWAELREVFWYEFLKDRDHFEEVVWRIIMKRILKKQNEIFCTRLIWLRIGISGGLLQTE
jgi:hypothetical protein